MTDEDFWAEALDRLGAVMPHEHKRLGFRLANPQLIAAFTDLILEKKAAHSTQPLPEGDRLTALQVTIHDNWGSERKAKGKNNRYGFTVEAWTCGDEKVRFEKGFWDHKFTGDLMDAKAIRKKADELLARRSIGADYAADLYDVAEAFPGMLFGMLRCKTQGTVYPDRQYLMVDAAGAPHAVAHGILKLTDDLTALPAFVPHGADKMPLGGKSILQARRASGARFHGWISGKSE